MRERFPTHSLSQRRQLATRDFAQDLLWHGALDRWAQRQEVVKNGAERVEIGAGVEEIVRTVGLLGGHVLWRAQDVPGRGFIFGEFFADAGADHRLRARSAPGHPGGIEHFRKTPVHDDQFLEGAVDLSLRLSQAVAPLADALIGNTAPADIALDATVNRASLLGTGTVARELERWRQAGGSLEIAGLSLAKGERRVQAKGSLGLDPGHRVEGQLDLRAAGVEGLVASIVGQRFGADRGALIGNLVGGLLGLRRKPEGAPNDAPGEAALKPLPPLRLADGRMMFGPIAIPNVRLQPLY